MNSDDPNTQNVSRCIEMADFHFKNNGTVEDLTRQVELVLEGLQDCMTIRF
jgi:dephospho-CoA kinase